jgi:hypothetical protein
VVFQILFQGIPFGKYYITKVMTFRGKDKSEVQATLHYPGAE